MKGKLKASLNVKSAYGVSAGPISVAVHIRRELLDGNADMPGVDDIMRAISSD